MFRTYKYMVEEADQDQRLDKYLARSLSELSRSDISSYISDGNVWVNNKIEKKSYRLHLGDQVVIRVPLEDLELLAEKKKLVVLYEDQYFLIIHKEAGWVVHPNRHSRRGTVVNFLLGSKVPLSTLGGQDRPGIIHRLDKDTSGLLIIAKDNQTHQIFKDLFKARKIQKNYYALVEGQPPAQGKIEEPIGRDPTNPTRMAVIEGGRPALTEYIRLAANENYSLMDINLVTGRTHQIRVHFSWLGHPVVGDKVYGGGKEKKDLACHLLHSYHLAFHHPHSGEWISITDPLPDYMEEFLQKQKLAP